MEESAMPQSFSLLGGPVHQLGRRLGLVRRGTNTTAMGLVLGPFLWTVLLVLVLVEGISHELFSLRVIGVNVRLLLVIPLLFLGETWLNPTMTAFVSLIVRSGVVPDSALPSLQSTISRTNRWKDSWLVEAICLLAAVLLSLTGRDLVLSGTTSAYVPGRGSVTLASLWFWIVCLPLFRFLVFRWIWRLGLWSYFLWRLAKLDLRLVPTHPDRAGGLGYLEIVHTHFLPLVLAISATQAAALAEDIHAGLSTFDTIFPSVAVVVSVEAVLCIGPLLIFAYKLWACRVTGMSDYMQFAAVYVRRFDRKWLKDEKDPHASLLGTADIQSLADLSNSVSIVRNMRVVPVSTRMLLYLSFSAVVPLLPLLLFRYPLAELTQKLLTRLAGLD